MRHRVYGKHLGRSSNERTALFKNLVRSLILHETIETTQSKAKAIKGLVDKLITQAKSPQTRRLVIQFLSNTQVSEKLIQEIVPTLSGRVSGYTSVVKVGRRVGDGAMVVKMSLITDKKQKVEAKESAEKKVASPKSSAKKITKKKK